MICAPGTAVSSHLGPVLPVALPWKPADRAASRKPASSLRTGSYDPLARFGQDEDCPRNGVCGPRVLSLAACRG